MTLLRYREDRWPVAIATSGVLLSLAPFVIEGSAGWLLAIVGVLFRVLIPIHQHNHSHLSTFKQEPVNAVYDMILALGGGNLTTMWRVHHGMGHHVDYLDQENDVEGNLRFGRKMPFRRLVFTVLGSALSLPDSFSLLKRFPASVQRAHRAAIFRQLALQIGVFVLLAILNLKAMLLIFVLPNVFLKMAVFWFSYGQHDDLPMTNVYDSSTTKFRFGRKLLNVEYHTAHHERPGVHWSRLERRTEEILPLIHEKCVRR